ncbi:MAG: Dabb family protein [Sphingopyxis sp.]|nr:Dabb family protein [Sphingopyxis sp.]
MFKLTRLVTLADPARLAPLADELRALARMHEAWRTLVAPTLPGSHFGGDLLAHFVFDSAGQRDAFGTALAPLLAGNAVDGADYQGSPDGKQAPDLANGVYRVLLLSVDDGTDPESVAQFEAETRMMPHYISAIRNWQLSRIEAAIGERRWTHVWEQEYAGAEGLLGPYMLHPYHWARIDRWFDPECPERIVDARLCHSFCALEASIL